jgi:GTPase SAR1 family protein
MTERPLSSLRFPSTRRCSVLVYRQTHERVTLGQFERGTSESWPVDTMPAGGVRQTMKTDLNTFCTQFSSELKPFLEGVRTALSDMPAPEDVEESGAALQKLNEAERGLSGLWDKVEGQRTFLLIFGPLKSGKSTLMNALAGAYVSEVSSLPAYPSLVYVKDGPQQRFVAIDYQGKRTEFPNNLELADAVEADHLRLAEALVEAENRGEAFEPEKHCPQAVYRMDIEVPAPHLAESGTVLVDTPGLYSRMRFGYDQMTRDFRDTASCAVFVVKTDNLFFEKVFEEFEELLKSFSRVFLVSNIDSSKKDLRPDGSLEASLESSDPDKIVDAFRALSMSASVQGAIDDGRLKIYPIDLLQAASRTLRQASDGVPAAPQDDIEGTQQRDDGFDEFVADLTGYLNSADYLHDFVTDTLRQAEELTSGVDSVVSSHAVGKLVRGIQQDQQELEQQKKRLQANAVLEGEAWSEAFHPLRTSSGRLLDELAEQGDEAFENACTQQLSAWMESDESWNDLLQARLQPQFEEASRRQASLVRESLRETMAGSDAGAEFSPEQLERLQDAELPWEEALSAQLQEFGKGLQVAAAELTVDTESIPLARTMGDMLMLRSRSRVRDDVFGDGGNLAIPASVKHKRLYGEGLEALRAALKDVDTRKMAELRRAHADELVRTHIRRCTDALEQLLAQHGDRLRDQIKDAEHSLERRRQAQKVMEKVRAGITQLDGELTRLRGDFQRSASESLGAEDSFSSD